MAVNKALDLIMSNDKARRILAKFELAAKEWGWTDEQYRANRQEVLTAIIVGIPEIHDQLSAN